MRRLNGLTACLDPSSSESRFEVFTRIRHQSRCYYRNVFMFYLDYSRAFVVG